MVLITFDLIFLFLVLLSDIYFHAFYLQRHDIIKKRIDAHGSVIEARQDGIGSPKVSNKIFLEVHLWDKHFSYISMDQLESYVLMT